MLVDVRQALILATLLAGVAPPGGKVTLNRPDGILLLVVDHHSVQRGVLILIHLCSLLFNGGSAGMWSMGRTGAVSPRGGGGSMHTSWATSLTRPAARLSG
jgi:hypothetical protein